MNTKKTKIVCTLGPACQDVKTLTAMVEAGMNVARLNFSHGDHQSHAALIANIRKVSEKLKTPIGIIQDLHGPKIRIQNLKKPIDAKIGQTVVIGQDFMLGKEVMQSLKVGQHVLIEDGLIELQVSKIQGGKIYCVALSAGKIQDKKGVNLPRTKLKIPILTPKDIDDLKFGLKQDVDFVALSFVRTRADVVHLKKLIKQYNPKGMVPPKIIAKIEKPEAVRNFDGILKEADAIMVARGDLGVEMPEAQVPIIQKTIIQKCLHAAKPVIVATQMLDSMIRNPRPTRAEVSDVANAVIDNTDCVMLSGETAFGRYPLEAVQQMTRIIQVTERSVFLPGHSHLLEKTLSRSEAVSESVYDLATHTKAKVIVGATESGFTAREIARERPPFTRIIMLTPVEKVQRQMCLLWGTAGFLVPLVKRYEDLVGLMIKTVKDHKIVKKGEQLVIATGEPMGQRENLNLVEIKTV
jgi:pyruvate kinase